MSRAYPLFVANCSIGTGLEYNPVGAVRHAVHLSLHVTPTGQLMQLTGLASNNRQMLIGSFNAFGDVDAPSTEFQSVGRAKEGPV